MTTPNWIKFRSSLRRALECQDEPNLESIVSEAGSTVDPAILKEYLDNKRGDLPDGYVSALCKIDALGLTTSDYRTTSAPLSLPNHIRQAPVAMAYRAGLKRINDNRADTSRQGKPRYVSLNCIDPDAMKHALNQAIRNAGVSRVDIARTFSLPVTGRSQVIALDSFICSKRLNQKGCGPEFPLLLQARFYEICEFLNKKTQAVTGNSPITTEQYMEKLFREGTVKQDSSELVRMLRDLNVYVYKHEKAR